MCGYITDNSILQIILSSRWSILTETNTFIHLQSTIWLPAFKSGTLELKSWFQYGAQEVRLLTVWWALGRGHTNLTSRELMWCYAWSLDVRGDLTLNSMAQIHTSVTLLTSSDLTWSSGRLTLQHASHSTRWSRLTKCVLQQKCERRAGAWADQSSTWDHVT